MALYDISVDTIDGKTVSMEQFRHQVLLIVNVASQCGYTKQYKELETLYERYNAQGLQVLAFPCNQFGNQEPGSHEEIAAFCKKKDVTFPLFAKIEVNGKNAHPLYVYLKSQKSGLLGTKSVKWNFTKFLVGRTGKVLKRYAPALDPMKIEADIKKALKEQSPA